MLTAPLLLGFMLGVRHAADADHVATIANVVVNRSGWSAALRTALYWGIGHSISFFLIGLGVVLLQFRVLPGFELAVELLIAFSLLLLGVLQIANSVGNRVREAPIHPSRPLALGTMHGLAGSAAIALVALTTIHSQSLALLYLLSFGVGTVAGMALITSALVWAFGRSRGLSWAPPRAVVFVTGVVGAGCGALIAWDCLKAG